MVKTLKFGDKETNFQTSFTWMFIYKSQFKIDPAKTIIPVIQRVFIESENETEAAFRLFEMLGFTGIAELAWATAKNYDRSLPDPLTWIESFGDNFAPMDIVEEILPDLIEGCFMSSKNSPAPAEKKPERK